MGPKPYDCWGARRDITFYFSGQGTRVESDQAYDRVYDHVIGPDNMITCELCLACWNKYRRRQEQAAEEEDSTVIKG